MLAHKCSGGIGKGKVNMKFYNQKTEKSIWENFNLDKNLTRVSYDGFRGVGSHWNYMWATTTGFNKVQHHKNNLKMPY